MKPPAQSPEYRSLTSAAECVVAQERGERIELLGKPFGLNCGWKEMRKPWSSEFWADYFRDGGQARLAIARPVEGVERQAEGGQHTWVGYSVEDMTGFRDSPHFPAFAGDEWLGDFDTLDEAQAACIANARERYACQYYAPASPKPVELPELPMSDGPKYYAHRIERSLDDDAGDYVSLHRAFLADAAKHLRAYATEALRAQLQEAVISAVLDDEDFGTYEVHIGEVQGNDDALVVSVEQYEKLLRAYEALRAQGVAELVEAAKQASFAMADAADSEFMGDHYHETIARLRAALARLASATADKGNDGE